MNKIDNKTQLKNNACATIGVGPSASEEQIRIEFIKLAKTYHPDVNGNDTIYTEKFIQIIDAYELLKKDFRQDQQENRSRCGIIREDFYLNNNNLQHLRRRARLRRIFWQCLITITVLLVSLATFLLIIWANTKTDWVPNCC